MEDYRKEATANARPMPLPDQDGMPVTHKIQTTDVIVIDNHGADSRVYHQLDKMPKYPDMLRKAADLLENYHGMLVGISVHSDDQGERLILKVHPFK